MAFRDGDGRDSAGITGSWRFVFGGAVIAVVIFVALTESLGMPDAGLALLLVGASLAAFALIGIASRTVVATDYFVAGRRIPSAVGGLAIAASWIPGGAFLGLAGLALTNGAAVATVIVGWMAGLALILILIAPYLRRSQAITVPDFFRRRFSGEAMPTISMIALVAASFPIAILQLSASGRMIETVLGLPYVWSVYLSIGLVLACSLLGGMRALTWTLAFQAVLLLAALVVPIGLMSYVIQGHPLPQVSLGEALSNLAAFGDTTIPASALDGAIGPGDLPLSTPDGSLQSFFLIALCFAMGTAAFPHVLMHFNASRSTGEARRAAVWALAAVGLFALTIPAYAVFAKLEIFQSLIGQSIDGLPAWLVAGETAGLVTVCGAVADSAEALAAACVEQGITVIGWSDIFINPGVLVAALPSLGGLPFAMTALVSAGALAALLSTATGLLLAIGNTLAHDGYYRLLNRSAPPGRRLAVARLFLMALAAGATYCALSPPVDFTVMAGWAVSLAAAGNFPGLVLSIWWGRCTSTGALAGMAAGFFSTLAYLVYLTEPPFGAAGDPILGLTETTAALIGVPVGFAVAVIVSLAAPAPSASDRLRLHSIRGTEPDPEPMPVNPDTTPPPPNA
ncbi:MAG: VC_2705 family sodium/solute symporter [Pseudomonadota bacterium]